MDTITLKRDELKKLIYEILGEVLEEKRELLDEAIVEILEDKGMLKAIEESKNEKFIELEEFKEQLNSRINELK
jgi:hypothetical protein